MAFLVLSILLGTLFSVALHRAAVHRWAPYDPGWLVDAARRQYPAVPKLSEALSRCTRARHEGKCYVRFVSSLRANRPGAAWQFGKSITLEDTAQGDVVLDV